MQCVIKDDANDIVEKVYLLATAADVETNTVGGARKGMEGWVACFPKAQLQDVLFCGGVTGAGEIEGNEALARARLMGNNVSI